MDFSPHNILVGEGAHKFALQHSFTTENVLTAESENVFKDWAANRKEKTGPVEVRWLSFSFLLNKSIY